LRSERETRKRREMQADRQLFILSRLTSFSACLAAGRACVLRRLCSFAEQTALPRAGTWCTQGTAHGVFQQR
jgi:hypothetical protein